VFERASKEPLAKGVSGLYTKAGHEKLIMTGVQAATAATGAEGLLVLLLTRRWWRAI
jgi:type VI protein secretion system component VasK